MAIIMLINQVNYLSIIIVMTQCVITIAAIINYYY